MTIANHTDLEAGRHPDRMYFSKLLAAQPQFSADRLIEEVQKEILYWTGLLNAVPTGGAFTMTFENIEHCVAALRHENDALKDVLNAMRSYASGQWADASNYYTRAISDLHFTLSDWGFALSRIADDTPFDHYRGTTEERRKDKTPEPPRTSLADMQLVSPHLFRIYQNMDRVIAVGVELVQRQITCLTNYMSEAEAQAYSPEAITAALTELVTRWGYRDITTLMMERYQQQEQEHPEEIYLAILQTPEGGPVYCKSASRLLQALKEARETGVEYTECPASSPIDNRWLVAGNSATE